MSFEHDDTQIDRIIHHITNEVLEAEQRYSSAHERSDRLMDQAVIGLLSLNGASVVALFTAFQAGNAALKKFGLEDIDITISFICFMFGAIFAIPAVWFEMRFAKLLAGKRAIRLRALHLLRASLVFSSEHSDEEIEDLWGKVKKAERTDFVMSKGAVVFLHFALVCWIIGCLNIIVACVMH